MITILLWKRLKLFLPPEYRTRARFQPRIFPAKAQVKARDQMCLVDWSLDALMVHNGRHDSPCHSCKRNIRKSTGVSVFSKSFSCCDVYQLIDT